MLGHICVFITNAPPSSPIVYYYMMKFLLNLHACMLLYLMISISQTLAWDIFQVVLQFQINFVTIIQLIMNLLSY